VLHSDTELKQRAHQILQRSHQSKTLTFDISSKQLLLAMDICNPTDKGIQHDPRIVPQWCFVRNVLRFERQNFMPSHVFSSSKKTIKGMGPQETRTMLSKAKLRQLRMLPHQLNLVLTCLNQITYSTGNLSNLHIWTCLVVNKASRGQGRGFEGGTG